MQTNATQQPMRLIEERKNLEFVTLKYKWDGMKNEYLFESIFQSDLKNRHCFFRFTQNDDEEIQRKIQRCSVFFY